MTTLTIPATTLRYMIESTIPFLDKSGLIGYECMRLHAHGGNLTCTATDRYTFIRLRSPLPHPDETMDIKIDAALAREILRTFKAPRGSTLDLVFTVDDGTVTLAVDQGLATSSGATMTMSWKDIEKTKTEKETDDPYLAMLQGIAKTPTDERACWAAFDPQYLRRIPASSREYPPIMLLNRPGKPVVMECHYDKLKVDWIFVIMPMRIADQVNPDELMEPWIS